MNRFTHFMLGNYNSFSYWFVTHRFDMPSYNWWRDIFYMSFYVLWFNVSSDYWLDNLSYNGGIINWFFYMMSFYGNMYRFDTYMLWLINIYYSFYRFFMCYIGLSYYYRFLLNFNI